MQADLHSTVRETYRQAISKRKAQREAFELATELLRARKLHVKPVEARRLVAKMLCYEPPALHGNGESSSVSSHGVSEMTNKSPKTFSRRLGTSRPVWIKTA